MLNYITAAVALWLAFDLLVVFLLLRGTPTPSIGAERLTPVG